jgi:DNA-binding MarR family transcriptional regulator
MIWLLRRASRHYGTAVRVALDRRGFRDLPQRGFWALDALSSPGQTATDLVVTLDLSKQLVSQLVDLLVELGYVERSSSPEDRRRVLLGLSARGMAAQTVIQEACAAVQADLDARLGERTVATLRRALGEVTAT